MATAPNPGATAPHTAPTPAQDPPQGTGAASPSRAPDLLATLVDLVAGSATIAARALPGLVDRAARELGVTAVLYLPDYATTQLVPFVDADAPGHRAVEPLGLDGTMAGRAFRLGTVLGAVDDGQARLWVPVARGIEQVGVLAVTVPDESALDDAELQAQVEWFARTVGFLVAELGENGDAVDALRRRRSRNVAAELVWQLLPPMNAGTDLVRVSGRVEPSYRVGGDVFDFAIDAHHIDLAVIDATGHGLRAGLVSATAISAYRNARREGAGLLEQVETIHGAIVEQFAQEVFATGVIARLDLDTGLLRYVGAGHPYPLVVRDGRVVRTLTDGRRVLFGIDAAPGLQVGEEQLEPGDFLLIYTDGVTEARDETGAAFGVEGLSDFVGRELAEQIPLPEMVRRLCGNIFERQSGAPRDDATLLIAQWRPGALTTDDPGAPTPSGDTTS